MASSGKDKEELSARICVSCHRQFGSDTTICPDDGTPLTQIKQDSLIGTTFADKYEVLDVIGGGGMGLVYQARHKLMGRTVALKVLHADMANAEALKRFRLESQAASSLTQPNIVTIYDFGVSADGQPYMVMDYLEGQSLDDLITGEGRVLSDRALNIFIQICNGLAHAHAKGVIHRDIKPSNIVLIHFEGQADFVKLVDFGIAKVINPSDPSSGDLTRTGEVFGSPLYMSPEQWRGANLDPRTDIYSLGSVMYKALTGQPLFSYSDMVQVMQSHVSEKPAPMSDYVRDVPVELERIVLKALEKDREIRFQSMLEMAQALKSLQDQLTARSVTAGQTTLQEGRATDFQAQPQLGIDRNKSVIEKLPTILVQSDPEKTVVSQSNQASSAPASKETQENLVPIGSVPRSSSDKEKTIQIVVHKKFVAVAAAIGTVIVVALLGFMMITVYSNQSKPATRETNSQPQSTSASHSTQQLQQPELIEKPPSAVERTDTLRDAKSSESSARVQHHSKHHTAERHVEHAAESSKPSRVGRIKDSLKNFLRRL